jgi:hypothetical protein
VRRSTRVSPFALDLHVLGTPPAFVLSQDQTLQLNFEEFRTGIVEARLRDSRLRCSGRSLNRLTPTRIGAPSEIDCGFRNPSSLGLLFGFQRPSRLSPPRLSATVFPLLGSTPFNPGAAFSISKRLFCQAAVAAPLPPLHLASASTRRRCASPPLLSRGRGTYFASASLVNRLRRLSLPFGSASFAASRGCGFYHRRVECQLPFVDFVFRLFQSRPDASTASAASLLRSRGRGFYHHRILCQPTSSTLFFPPIRLRGRSRPRTKGEGPGTDLRFRALLVARSTGLEPVASGVTGRRSNQLN